MYLYIEARGHYLRFGKLQPPKPDVPDRIINGDTPMRSFPAPMRRGYHLGPAINPQMQDDRPVQL